VDKTVQEIYGNRLRVRVCGLCWKQEKLLMVNHFGIYNHDFWAPPGGGAELGYWAADNLEREFKEETGLLVKTEELQFICEFVRPPLHAIELFFNVKVLGGNLVKGTDPEMGENQQIIRQVEYLSSQELENIPDTHKHGMFRNAKSIEKIRGLKGYLKI
jgi:8-oxo-dGTP diphosphatase